LIELRIDVPPNAIPNAIAQMNAQGWSLDTSPDGAEDVVCRLYFRRMQSLTENAKTEMLTHSLRVAADSNGTLISWINVEDLES
jgi:hypothetical protein